MSDPPAINLSASLASVEIMDNYPRPVSDGPVGVQEDAEHILTNESEAQKEMFLQACRTLNGVIDKLNQFYEKAFFEHREEIAGLSVEIARKILMQKVENGDYEIESIVKEVLTNAPSCQDVVVHLHPEDLAQCRKAQHDGPGGALDGITFISDPNIGRAECLVESPKGIIKSLINENLERIDKALKGKE
jgi:flagellar biosynthesis/type III secretory pathway protein FliH